MIKFSEFIDKNYIDDKTLTAAHYIAVTNFPINMLVDWCLVEGSVLTQEEFELVLEGFWDNIKDKAKQGAQWGGFGGAALGAAPGAAAAGAGAALGGGLGAGVGALGGGLYGAGQGLYNAGKNLAQGVAGAWRGAKQGFKDAYGKSTAPPVTTDVEERKTHVLNALNAIKQYMEPYPGQYSGIIDKLISTLQATNMGAVNSTTPSTGNWTNTNLQSPANTTNKPQAAPPEYSDQLDKFGKSNPWTNTNVETPSYSMPKSKPENPSMTAAKGQLDKAYNDAAVFLKDHGVADYENLVNQWKTQSDMTPEKINAAAEKAVLDQVDEVMAQLMQQPENKGKSETELQTMAFDIMQKKAA